jgi:hypothetical protein
MTDIATAHRGGDGPVVVVAHGGVTVDLLRTIVSDVVLRDRYPSLIEDGVPSCGLTRLRVGGDWTVESVGSTEHLGAATGTDPSRSGPEPR